PPSVMRNGLRTMIISKLLIDAFDDRHAAERFGGIAHWSHALVDCRYEFSGVGLPRMVCEWVPARCPGRTDPEQHAGEGEAFDAIGAPPSSFTWFKSRAVPLFAPVTSVR